MLPPERLPAEILSTQKLGPSVIGLKIRAATPFSWLPGQHLELGLAGAEERAPYSIASAPHPSAPGVFEVAVSTRNSNFLVSAQPGAHLWISEPRGNFVRTSMAGPTLFVAVGTGVAPLRAMIQSELQAEAEGQPSDRQVLLFGCRTDAEILFKQEFEALARMHARFEFIPTLTDASASWQGARGRVQTHLAKILQGGSASHAFVCGTSEMAETTSAELQRLGLSAENIHRQGHG